MRVPLASGTAWFKACGPVQAFEPRLTAELFARWPDRIPEVIGFDQERGWLLLADAGTMVAEQGNPPGAWEKALPLYAEMQREEATRADERVGYGVPDLRIGRLAERYEDLLRHDLPLADEEVHRIRRFEGRFRDLCTALANAGIPETIQHDDLHMNNLYVQHDRHRVLDWGDSSAAHPFFSLVVTFRFLQERNRLPAGDPWFGRLRDAYLEPWGPGHAETFALGLLVGAVAHGIAWARQRTYLPAAALADFDTGFAIVLRRALATVGGTFRYLR